MPNQMLDLLLPLLNHLQLRSMRCEPFLEGGHDGLRFEVLGLHAGDIGTGGVNADLNVVFPFPGFAVFEDAKVKVSMAWINHILANSPELSNSPISLELSLHPMAGYLLLKGLHKQKFPFAIDCEVGVENGLLRLTMENIRYMGFLPILAIPGLRAFTLFSIAEALQDVKFIFMREKDIFIDLSNIFPIPVDLRWSSIKVGKESILLESHLNTIYMDEEEFSQQNSQALVVAGAGDPESGANPSPWQ